MKSAIIALCIIACAYASAVSEDTAQVLRSDFELRPEGDFQYGYETENGISGQATGTVKITGKDEATLEVVGSNSYTDVNGQPIELTYTANEFGYQPKGAHLPTAPPPQPIPEYIQRALEYIAAHPYVEKKQ